MVPMNDTHKDLLFKELKKHVNNNQYFIGFSTFSLWAVLLVIKNYGFLKKCIFLVSLVYQFILLNIE